MSTAAVVLDFDGTILDTESANSAAHAAKFARVGVEFDPTVAAALIGARGWEAVDPLFELAAVAGAGFDLAEARARVWARHLALVEASPVRPGVAGLLAAARAAGVPVAVASSSPHEWVDGHLARLGLSGDVVTTCCAEDVSRIKPYPDLYLLACDRLRVTPVDALAVEESANGVRAAVAAGLFCVAVPNTVTAPHDLSTAHLRLDSLADLPWPDLVRAHSAWRLGDDRLVGRTTRPPDRLPACCT